MKWHRLEDLSAQLKTMDSLIWNKLCSNEVKIFSEMVVNSYKLQSVLSKITFLSTVTVLLMACSEKKEVRWISEDQQISQPSPQLEGQLSVYGKVESLNDAYEANGDLKPGSLREEYVKLRSNSICRSPEARNGLDSLSIYHPGHSLKIRRDHFGSLITSYKPKTTLKTYTIEKINSSTSFSALVLRAATEILDSGIIWDLSKTYYDYRFVHESQMNEEFNYPGLHTEHRSTVEQKSNKRYTRSQADTNGEEIESVQPEYRYCKFFNPDNPKGEVMKPELMGEKYQRAKYTLKNGKTINGILEHQTSHRLNYRCLVLEKGESMYNLDYNDLEKYVVVAHNATLTKREFYSNEVINIFDSCYEQSLVLKLKHIQGDANENLEFDKYEILGFE